jgi:hypothetical protein
VYSDNLIEVVEWCMAMDPLSRPQSVFALQKELSREGERRYTKLSMQERMRMQLDNMVHDGRIFRNWRLRTWSGDRQQSQTMKFSVFQLSRRGGRALNEDRMGYCYTREAALFVLADGMGGHPDGEVAAQIALQVVSTLFQQKAKPMLEEPALFLEEALLQAHRQILRYASTKGMMDTPRTTLVAAVLQDGKVTGYTAATRVCTGCATGSSWSEHVIIRTARCARSPVRWRWPTAMCCSPAGLAFQPIFDVSETRRLERAIS